MNFKKVGSLKYKSKPKEILIPMSSIEEGSNIKKEHIVYKDEDLIKVFSRKCDHSGGKLCNLNGRITCPMHGWEFNPQTGSYNNVQFVKKEEDFEVINDSIVVKFKTLIPELPSEDKDYELSIELLSHACLLFKTEEFSFATDPWIDGFAFSSGWWIAQKTPENWIKKLNSVDFIYISHNHPDHLNEFTLKKIRKDMHFIVPEFITDSVYKILKRWGFKNITRFNFSSFYRYKNTNLHFSILKSGDFREDSGFYFTYGNFKCLSSVDSNDLNFSRLPENITMYCSNFAGGASGYPICFENISEKKKKNIILRNRNAIKSSVKNQINICKPGYFLPYAGFFSERAPRDEYIKSLNWKNTTQDYIEVLKNIGVTVFDASNNDSFVFEGNYLKTQGKISREDNLPNNPEDFYQKAFTDINIDDEYIKNFFKNSNFSDNLSVYFQLTNDDFSKNNKSFVVDFCNDKTKVFFKDFNWEEIKKNYKNDNPVKYLLIKVRQDSFNWVIKNNMPFEDLSIGFQCRIDRVPDIYNVDFWHHFTNKYI